MRSGAIRRAARAWRAALAFAATACKGAPPQRKPGPTPVRVTSTSRIDAPVTVIASGVVEPMQTVSVTAQVSGTLQDVLFKEGDDVSKGQRLVQIDPRPLQAIVDQARATLTKDQATSAAAAKDDVRLSSLAKIGYVSRSMADSQHATALAAAATVQADEASLRAAQVNLGFASITAPISGRTGGLLVRRGNNVSPTSGPLVVINQISPVLARFPVLQQDFAPMQAAVARRPLVVTAQPSDSSGELARGTMSFLDNNVDSLTGTVTGKASFPNAERQLWPGELVLLTVQLRVERNVLSVPTDAILTGQQGPYVFVVDATNTAHIRQVVPGLVVASRTVIQRGLATGERVVVDGQSRIDDGTRIAITGIGTDTSGTTLLGSEVDNSAQPTQTRNAAAGEVVSPSRRPQRSLPIRK
jgi:membrane fusion protein, multidrug efflux system